MEAAPRSIPVPNNYDGPFPQGVPNPFGVRVHPYPTRFHGPVYTRPMASLPWRTRPSNNERALPEAFEGLGQVDGKAAAWALVAFVAGAALGGYLGYRMGKREAPPSRAIVFR